MKTRYFLLLVIALLLASETLTLLGSSKAAETLHALKAQSLSFFYKEDEKARFLDFKNQWQSAHRGEIPLKQAAQLASDAYTQSSVENELLHWRALGGPSPEVMSAKLDLYNTSPQALLDVPVQIRFRAKVGLLRVNPAVQMTDYDYLNQTAQWETVSNHSTRIAVIAPGEDMRLDLGRFELLRFLSTHPGKWPVELAVNVSAKPLGAHSQNLTLLPDHFVMPALY